jgi:hypothetical protein
MHSHDHSTTELPIAGKLAISFACAMAILVLTIAASVAGVLHSHAFYPADDLRRTFLPNDVVNLSIGLLFLMVSLLVTWRGRLAGLLALPGALLFVLYNSLVYVLGLPFGMLFLLHFGMVLLSACASVILVARIDASAVRRRLAGVVPERFAGCVLTGLGALFLFRSLGILLLGITHKNPIARTDLAVDLADLLITPIWIAGGILLIFRKSIGYVASIGLLSQASMLFVALSVFLPLQSLLTGGPFRFADAIVILLMGSVCFVPLVLFVRGAELSQSSSIRAFNSREQVGDHEVPNAPERH